MTQDSTIIRAFSRTIQSVMYVIIRGIGRSLGCNRNVNHPKNASSGGFMPTYGCGSECTSYSLLDNKARARYTAIGQEASYNIRHTDSGNSLRRSFASSTSCLTQETVA